LTWEYPRATPQGDQVDLVEVMDIADGHRPPPGLLGMGRLQGADGREERARLTANSARQLHKAQLREGSKRGDWKIGSSRSCGPTEKTLPI
jgi:hypothetical protein